MIDRDKIVEELKQVQARLMGIRMTDHWSQQDSNEFTRLKELEEALANNIKLLDEQDKMFKMLVRAYLEGTEFVDDVICEACGNKCYNEVTDEFDTDCPYPAEEKIKQYIERGKDGD